MSLIYLGNSWFCHAGDTKKSIYQYDKIKNINNILVIIKTIRFNIKYFSYFIIRQNNEIIGNS